MTAINTQSRRSSPFTSSFYGSFSSPPSHPRIPAATSTEPVADSVAHRTSVEPIVSAAQSAARVAPVQQDSSSWLSDVVNGAKAALEQLGTQIDVLSRVGYLRGQNGLRATNRTWARELGDTAGGLGAFGLGLGIAEETGKHGWVEGAIRVGVKEIGSKAGAVLGVLASPNLPLKVFGAATGAVLGENLSDAAIAEVSQGYWAADSLYDETLAAGGTLNQAASANLTRHQGWLTDRSLSPLERAGRLVVDGLQTFGGDVAVLWDGASDWLSGDESASSVTPVFDGPTFDSSEPEVTGGWSDFDDGAYKWSDFDDISSGASTVGAAF